MSQTILSIDEIVSNPKIRGGRPVIRGTSLRVQDIAAWTIYGKQTPEELAVGFNLTLAQVHAALSYYHAHKDEIDEQMRRDDEEAEAYRLELKAQGKLIELD